MQSVTEKNGEKVEFDLPPADRYKQLVNNEHLADIRFKVGQCGELIYAHKLVITMASEVFNTQFYGGFAEAQRDTLADPVVVEDIEPAPFLELLRYIYCKEVDIQPGNLLDIYYASEKYMLRSLGMMCEDSFYRLINETTVLKILEHNRRYAFPAVDSICLELIRDNPLKYFKEKEFLTLSQQAMQLIASSRAMNCSKDQLVQAIEQWEQTNGKKMANEVQLDKSLCRKLYFYDKCAYSSSIDTRFVLNVGTNRSIALHGMGIYVGVEGDSPTLNSTVSVTVNLNGFSVEATVPILDELLIYDVLFEKQKIYESSEISVKVVQQGNATQYKMFHLNGWSTMDGTMLTVTSCAPSNRPRTYCYTCGNYNGNCKQCRRDQINCVAYLLCSRKKTEAENLA